MSAETPARAAIIRALSPWFTLGELSPLARVVADDVRDHVHAADLVVVDRATVVAILGHHAAGLSLTADIVEPLRRALAKPQRGGAS